jgi:hypothetical protein
VVIGAIEVDLDGLSANHFICDALGIATKSAALPRGSADH